MPHNRFFIDAPLVVGETYTLADEEAHHLTHVMRVAVGARVELVNGKAELALATVQAAHKRVATVRVDSVERAEGKAPLIILAQALPRLAHLDFIVEKGTELGMDALWLFPGQRSEKKELTPTQLSRLHRIALGALKQCGRLTLPEIVEMPPLAAWPPATYSAHALYVANPHPNSVGLLQCFSVARSCCVFVGPEAGFSADEIGVLDSWGAQHVLLSRNVLRTETAAIAALSQIGGVSICHTT